MIIRKSVHSLSAGEKATFVRALLELKRRGRYEEYVHWHHPDGSVGCSIRTSRRQLQEWRSQGPAFLPWHGGFSMRVEADFRSIEPPNDPVFFLRHCFVDKVWTDWQECRRRTILIARPITRHFATGLRATISMIS
jgi:Common central domain of tyrosinase